MLIGTHRAFVLWDNGRSHVLHEGLGIYYGITWDDHQIYLVARGNQPSRMLVFDSTMHRQADLPYLHEGPPGDGPHQALYSMGILYVPNTQRNRVECWDGEKIFHLSWGPTDGDHDHANSIWREPEASTLWITEHRWDKRPKRFRVLRPDHSLLRTIELDPDTLSLPPSHVGMHNVYVENGTLYTLGPSQVIAYDLETSDVQEIELEGVVRYKHYLRGLARSDDHFFIGASNFRPRQYRELGASKILVTDASFKVVEEIRLEEEWGQIMEIRLIDGPDYAHNGIPCPLL
jgi:hypothetical protein